METVFNAPPEPQSQRQRKISDSQALLNGVRKLSTVHVPSFEPLPESGSNAGTRSSNSVDSNTNLRLRIPTVQPSNNVKDGIPLGAYANPAYSHLDENDEDRVGPLPSIKEKHLQISTVENTGRKISIGFDPTEAIPNATNYEELNGVRTRPTIDELITGNMQKDDPDAEKAMSMKKRGELGWIRGVLIWSILNLWGVMLFLRIAWMNAQAGMGLFLVIVLMGTVIAILTSLSTSAISTNGEIGTGGTYYMISRSLGPEFGTAIGIIFTLANTVNVSLNLQGFAETVANLLGEHGLYMVDKANDMRIIGVLALVGLTVFTFCGMEIASKLQMVFFVILIAAILNVFIGSFIPPSLEEQARGFVGYSTKNFADNWKPAFQNGETFMTVFGVFFPSVTGILAGTSITGDLRDPSSAIPKGTIIAILFTSASYFVVGWPSVAVTLRHASGNISDLLLNNTVTDCLSTEKGCSEGSINNYNIMQLVAHFRWIIVCGIFAATLSTSLGCIVFAPKIFQAVCNDKILPKFHIFGKGYGKNDEPYRAYGLLTIVAVIFLMPSDLNFISAIVSNFFLLTYALVNYATFNADHSRQPGWRPTFKYYNKWLSLATAAACIIIMFFLHWISAIISLGLIFVVFITVYYLKPTANWGTSTQAIMFRSALVDALKLLHVQEHVKNYRPQILAMTGLPCVRPALVYFANSITRASGLLITGHVLVGEPARQRKTVAQETYKWLQRTHVKAFYDSISCGDFLEGARALVQTSGLGKMRPNILLMGYKHDWKIPHEGIATENYVDAISEAFDNRMAVMILYTPAGLDISEAVNFDQLVLQNALTKLAKDAESTRKNSTDKIENVAVEVKEAQNEEMKARIELSRKFQAGKRNTITGEIHVWWLYDDGGLGLLIPHLLSRSSPWNGCKLKVFCLASKAEEGKVDVSKQSMQNLLAKFRIETLEVVPVNLDEPPGDESVRWFNNLISQHRATANKADSMHIGSPPIYDYDLHNLKEKTRRHIRIRELLLKHSSASTLNVVTMPLPRKNRSATLYLATLETLTADMPTTLLVRGAQQNVLTYYC